MADITIALKTVFYHEGLFVDDPRDPGGATKFGISLRFLQDYSKLSRQHFDRADIDNDGDVDRNDIIQLNFGAATFFYKENFWDKLHLDDVLFQPLATKLFDLSINMGIKQAVVCLQRALLAADGIELLQDGIFGPKTKSALNSSNSFEVMAAFKSEAAGFYRALVLKNPKLAVYLNGWLRRSYSDTI